MKKSITTYLMVIATVFTSSTFAQAFHEGDLDLNVGVGLGSYLGSGIPLSVSAEYGISDVISIGGIAGYASYSDKSFYGWKVTDMFIGGRGSFHFAELLNTSNDSWDPYAGLQLGFNIVKVDYNGYDYGYDYTNSSGLYFGGYVGSRYMFSEKIGVYGELGFGVSILQLGVTAKF